MGIGAFLIGPRTMETVRNEITVLSLEGALIVEVIAATIITFLSWRGIPASLAITAITCIIGLGWGRATRHVELAEGVGLGSKDHPQIDGGTPEEKVTDLFSEDTVRHVVTTWMLSPVVAAGLAFVCFKAGALLGLFSF